MVDLVSVPERPGNLLSEPVVGYFHDRLQVDDIFGVVRDQLLQCGGVSSQVARPQYSCVMTIEVFDGFASGTAEFSFDRLQAAKKSEPACRPTQFDVD